MELFSIRIRRTFQLVSTVMENSLSKYIILTEENMAKEHICCAFSDKKCTAGYELKKGSDSL